jgi:hypothetical protein
MTVVFQPASDIDREIQKYAEERGQSLEEAVNELLRTALRSRPKKERVPFVVQARDLGLGSLTAKEILTDLDRQEFSASTGR